MKLVLIDGHAILHRAFHALPPTLTNKDGISTNAIYGFMTMLLRILDDQQPTNLIVCFDLPQPTFRQQTYTQYQAQRPEIISNLKDQIPLIHELLDILKIPYFEVAGYEADDCIGTLAWQMCHAELDSASLANASSTHSGEIPKQVRDDKVEVVIVTGDRDMLQLINDHVKVCVPIKGLTETKTYDAQLVKLEFNVNPNQWVDVKALKGDASDNYPGVPGIGPKTAQDLIAKYETLESIYNHLKDIKPATAQKLAEGAESAGLSKKLATIVTDVPIHLDLEKCLVSQINWPEGTKYMREKLGFKSIADKIDKRFHGLKTDHTDTEQLGLI